MQALASWSMNMKGIAKVVTGGGKTSFALMCIEQYFSFHPKGSVLILVPSIALLDQWYVDILTETSLNDEDISIFGGGNSNHGKRKINISTLNTGRNAAKRLLSSDDLLIVDECHKAASEENSKSISHTISHYSLGLSATPERQYDDGFEDILIPKLGPLLIDYDYSKAKKDGVICDFALHNVKVKMSDEEEGKYNELTRKIALTSKKLGKDSIEYLNLCVKRREISNFSHLRIPTVCNLTSRISAKKTIIFHESIKSAEEIAILLNQRGHYALCYHSKLSDAIRRDNLIKFKTGTCDVLITCRALDEGANIPQAELGIIAASTKSERQRIQRLGRVLRKFSGKKIALIYTLYSTEAEQDLLLEESQGLEGLAEVKWLEAELS